VVLDRNSLVKLLYVFDDIPQFRLTDQDEGEKEAVVHLKIQEETHLFEGLFGDNLGLVDDQYGVPVGPHVFEQPHVQHIQKVRFR